MFSHLFTISLCQILSLETWLPRRDDGWWVQWVERGSSMVGQEEDHWLTSRESRSSSSPPRHFHAIVAPSQSRSRKDFVGLSPPKVQPVGSWMKGKILFCQELVIWLNTWEEHPVPRFQFNCCSTLLWVEIRRMSWKSLESFPRFVRWVPQSDPREYTLSLGWWTPKRGWGGLFPQLYRCRVWGYRSEWHPPRIFLRFSGQGTSRRWQLDLGWLQLDILQTCDDVLHLWLSLGAFHGRARWRGFVGRLGWCLQSIHKSNGLCARTDLSHRELARTRIQDVQHISTRPGVNRSETQWCTLAPPPVRPTTTTNVLQPKWHGTWIESAAFCRHRTWTVCVQTCWSMAETWGVMCNPHHLVFLLHPLSRTPTPRSLPTTPPHELGDSFGGSNSSQLIVVWSYWELLRQLKVEHSSII